MLEVTTLNDKKYALCCSIGAQLSFSDNIKDMVRAE
jgi:hypothetical protein